MLDYDAFGVVCVSEKILALPILLLDDGGGSACNEQCTNQPNDEG